MRHFNQEVIGQGNVDSFNALMDENFINRSAPAGMDNGPQGMIWFFNQILRPALSDLKVIIHYQVAESDMVTTRKTISGTHTGPLNANEKYRSVMKPQATIQIISRLVNSDEQAGENLKKLVGNAERHAKKLNVLVSDLLNSTKIEQGQLVLNKSIFTLADVIDGCCSHIQLAGGHFITYTGNHALKVTADQHKIDQVIVNFVNNAVKYAPGSDEIIVHVERLENSAKVSVTDKGPGIPSESVGKLFERYYRVDQYKKQISGLGLGLYISSEIIKRHDGQIGVESEIGKGSTF